VKLKKDEWGNLKKFTWRTKAEARAVPMPVLDRCVQGRVSREVR
jgi:hypothetical protein